MRILQVIPFFSPLMGGSAEVAFQISRHLARRGHAVTVVTTDYARRRAAYAPEGVQVVEIPNWLAGAGFYLNPGLMGWARRSLPAFDVLHLHTLRTFQNAVVAHFAARAHKPYLLSAHGTLPVIVERQLPKRLFDLLAGNRILRHAAAFHAVSEVEVEQYRTRRLPAERTHLVYNGLDVDSYASLPERGLFRQRLALPPGAPVILQLSRLHKRKRIDLLLRAFAAVAEAHPAAHLLVAGPDEGELAPLQALARRLELAHRVRFTAPVYGADKLALLRAADLVVSVGVHEIFGLVPFEAALCGVPALVSDDCGAGRLARREEIAWLVKSGDVADLAEKLRLALADPAAGQVMVQRARAFIQQHLAWDTIAQQFETLYQEMTHV